MEKPVEEVETFTGEENEKIFLENRQLADQQGVWLEGGRKKDKLIARVISLGAKFVNCQISHDGLTNSEIKQYTPLPDAAVAANELRKILESSDNSDTRDLTILLASYNIVQSQLLPLLHVSVNDGLTSRFCLRAISQLLIPMSTKTIEAAKSAFREKVGKETKEESIGRRSSEHIVKNNAMQQIAALLSFKEAFAKDEVMLITTCQSLVGPLKKAEAERSNTDNQMIETVLHVISNLLAIDAIPSCCSRNEIYRAMESHNELIKMFQGTIIKLLVTFCESIHELIFKDNMNFFLDIVANLYRGQDGKELFKVWRQGITGNKVAWKDDARSTAHDPSHTAKLPPRVEANSNGSPRPNIPKGSCGLRSKLKSEKTGRKELLSVKNAGTVSGRSSRYPGLYSVPIASISTTCNATVGQAGSSLTDAAGSPSMVKEEPHEEENETSQPSKTKVVPLNQFVVRNPFARVGDHLPQEAPRNWKKNVTFAVDEEEIHHLSLPESDVLKAATVITGFVEEFSKKAFDRLVTVVKEDLRRDENRVGTAEELQYFRICSTTLKYHRLKVQHGKEGRDISESSAWPDIKCMMPSLDKMSFFRVISAIKRHLSPLEGGKRFDVVMVPMQTYKEMLGYLHLMLQSTNEAFHELAVAALFMLFYVSTERLDPLPQLLREWKPGTYTRRHSHLLVELVHETMKVLDLAHETFSGRASRKEKLRERDVDIDRYVSAALKFDVIEYFRRLVTNTTVKFYTRMIADYRNHSIQSRHYVQSFIRRLLSHGVMSEEDQNEDNIRHFNAVATATRVGPTAEMPSSSSIGNTTAATAIRVTLSYMLFNIHTLIAISTVLNDAAFCKEPGNGLFVRVLKFIVISFSEAVAKNKLLFVEALFQHPHPHGFCSQIDSVYDATAIAAGFQRASSSAEKHKTVEDSDTQDSDSGSDFDSDTAESPDGDAEPVAGEGDASSKLSKREKKNRKNKENKGAADGSKVFLGNTDYNKKFELGDEFDEDDLFETISGEPVASITAAPLKKLKSKSKSAPFRADPLSTSPSQSLLSRADNTPPTKSAHRSPGMSKRKSSKSKRAVPEWTKAEDDILREQYALYVGTYSMYDMIVDHFTNKNVPGGRNAKQIRQRVKYLKLEASFARKTDTVVGEQTTTFPGGSRMEEELDSEEDSDAMEVEVDGLTSQLAPPVDTDSEDDTPLDPSTTALFDELNASKGPQDLNDRHDASFEEVNFRKWLPITTPGSEDVSVRRKRLHLNKSDGEEDGEDNTFEDSVTTRLTVGVSDEGGVVSDSDLGDKRKIAALSVGPTEDPLADAALAPDANDTSSPTPMTYGKRRYLPRDAEV